MESGTVTYFVAGHRFTVTAPSELIEQMGNYSRFTCPAFTNEPDDVCVQLFRLGVNWGVEVPVDYEELLCQDDEGQQIVCGRITGPTEGGTIFVFKYESRIAGWLTCSPDYTTARLVLTGWQCKPALDSAIMVLYSLSAAPYGTVLFHASAVCLDGKGYMFLGKSGTGKSTHSRLWLENVTGSSLFNDDNPVVRVLSDGTVRVFGSPWSGKTPCYHNISYPLAALVKLSQAPFNRIDRLVGVTAYAAVIPGVSGIRWDRHIADGLHNTENSIARTVPVWSLECLPDAEAARLCSDTVTLKSDS